MIFDTISPRTVVQPNLAESGASIGSIMGSIPTGSPNNFPTERNLHWYDGCGLNLYHPEWAELLVKIVMYYMLLLYIACVVCYLYCLL